MRPHLKEDERAFRIVKKGLEEVWRDPSKKARALSFVKKHLKGHKQKVWEALLNRSNYEKELNWLFGSPSYEKLPLEAKNWWSIYLQDHPFSSIFAREIRKLQREKRLSWQKAVEELLKT